MNPEIYFTGLQAYITQLFLDNQDDKLVYHNLAHTKKVVFRCMEMAAHYELGSSDDVILYTAAWFHDTGHLFSRMESHETESVRIMLSYVEQAGMTAHDIQQVEGCILSTRIPQRPVTLLDKILCDADLYHFGTAEFILTDPQVKRETELRNEITITGWEQGSLRLLQAHSYFTDYCRQRLNKGKEENIHYLEHQLP